MSTISGNLGGPNAQGADAYCTPQDVNNPTGILIASGDANGDFSFPGLTAGTYFIRADAADITSGPYVGFVYRKSYAVPVDGVNDMTGIDLTPIDPKSSNSGVPQ